MPIKKEGDFFYHHFDLLGTSSGQENKSKPSVGTSSNPSSSSGIAAHPDSL
jgi:hypothetical protein